MNLILCCSMYCTLIKVAFKFRAVVYNSEVMYSRGAAVRITGGSSGASIVNTHLTDNGGDGVLVSTSTDIDTVILSIIVNLHSDFHTSYYVHIQLLHPYLY